MISNRTVVYTLAYCGLIPFVGAACYSIFSSTPAATVYAMVNAYALAIISFLTGTWWGLALPGKNPYLLIVSNIFFLFAFAGYLFADNWWPLLAALILATILGVEQTMKMLLTLPEYYQKTRAILTLIASFSMLFIYATGSYNI